MSRDTFINIIVAIIACIFFFAIAYNVKHDHDRAKACIESGGEIVMYAKDRFICKYPPERQK